MSTKDKTMHGMNTSKRQGYINPGGGGIQRRSGDQEEAETKNTWRLRRSGDQEEAETYSKKKRRLRRSGD